MVPGSGGGRGLSPTPRVLALLHLPPPVHGLSLKNQRLVEGRVAGAVDLEVLPLRFAASLADLGRFRPGKLVAAAGVLLEQRKRLRRGTDVGYMSITTAGGGLVRDAAYMHAFRRAGVPYALHVPTLGLADGVAAIPGPVRGWVRSAVAGAAAVMALNEAHGRELARVVPAGRVRIVRNGLPDLADLPGLASPPVRRRPPATEPRVLFLSNVREAKGIFTLLEAAPQVLEAFPGARFVVAGPWEDAATERRFGAAVGRLGLGDRVEYVGPVYDAAKLDLLASVSLLAFPSHRENAPNTVLEAMRQGLPVVASRVGGIPEMVEDGRTGLLVEPGDPTALAGAIRAILRDPETAAELGRCGREKFEREYTMDRWEDDIIRLIEELHAGG